MVIFLSFSFRKGIVEFLAAFYEDGYFNPFITEPNNLEIEEHDGNPVDIVVPIYIKKKDNADLWERGEDDDLKSPIKSRREIKFFEGDQPEQPLDIMFTPGGTPPSNLTQPNFFSLSLKRLENGLKNDLSGLKKSEADGQEEEKKAESSESPAKTSHNEKSQKDPIESPDKQRKQEKEKEQGGEQDQPAIDITELFKTKKIKGPLEDIAEQLSAENAVTIKHSEGFKIERFNTPGNHSQMRMSWVAAKSVIGQAPMRESFMEMVTETPKHHLDRFGSPVRSRIKTLKLVGQPNGLSKYMKSGAVAQRITLKTSTKMETHSLTSSPMLRNRKRFVRANINLNSDRRIRVNRMESPQLIPSSLRKFSDNNGVPETTKPVGSRISLFGKKSKQMVESLVFDTNVQKNNFVDSKVRAKRLISKELELDDLEDGSEQELGNLGFGGNLGKQVQLPDGNPYPELPFKRSMTSAPSVKHKLEFFDNHQELVDSVLAQKSGHDKSTPGSLRMIEDGIDSSKGSSNLSKSKKSSKLNKSNSPVHSHKNAVVLHNHHHNHHHNHQHSHHCSHDNAEKALSKLSKHSSRSKISEAIENNLCVICFANPPNAVYLPCGHGSICVECTKDIFETTNTCPICRSIVTQMVEIDIHGPKRNGCFRVMRVYIYCEEYEEESQQELPPAEPQGNQQVNFAAHMQLEMGEADGNAVQFNGDLAIEDGASGEDGVDDDDEQVVQEISLDEGELGDGDVESSGIENIEPVGEEGDFEVAVGEVDAENQMEPNHEFEGSLNC